MPEPNDNNGGAGDDAAAKAAAAAKGAGNGAPDGEEMITVKKSEYDKVISDRDNYRTAVISKKADERKLDNKPVAGDPVGQIQLDENKIKEIARAEASGTLKQIHDANESRAKRQFFKDNPEYLDDANYQRLIAQASFRRGKATVEDIVDDLSDAVLLDKKNTGKLDEYMKQQADRSIQQSRINGMMDIARAGSGGGDHQGGGATSGLTPAGEQMAQKLHRDPAKVSKIDYNRDREIQP